MHFAFFVAATHVTFLAMILLLTLIKKVRKPIVSFLLVEYFAAFTPLTIIAILFEQTVWAVLIIFILHNLVLAAVAGFLPRAADGRPASDKS